MSYCPNCGGLIQGPANFCPNCGAPIQAVPAVTVTTPVTYANPPAGEYSVILVSRGTCSRAVAIDMIGDLLGYTDDEAARLVDGAPMAVGIDLTGVQAQYISQALSEYGMEVSVFSGDGYVDLTKKATASVFDSDGSFLSVVAGVLAGIGIGNRVRDYTRWTRPQPVVFRPVYRRPAPPTAYRRRRPAPKPAVRPVHPVPHAAAPVRPAPVPPRPAPRPEVTPVRPPQLPKPTFPPHPVSTSPRGDAPAGPIRLVKPGTNGRLPGPKGGKPGPKGGKPGPGGR